MTQQVEWYRAEIHQWTKEGVMLTFLPADKRMKPLRVWLHRGQVEDMLKNMRSKDPFPTQVGRTQAENGL